MKVKYISNGASERMLQTLQRTLKAYVSKKKTVKRVNEKSNNNNIKIIIINALMCK